MGRKKVEGTCHICSDFTKLSFEHVPPHSAYNDRPIIDVNKDILFGGDLDKLRGPTEQRGSGAYTLCEPCNSKTGHWYGTAYAEWAAQGMEALKLLRVGHPGAIRFDICPLNVLKQIVCMMFSVNSHTLAQRNPDLVKFVLDPTCREWNPTHQVYINFNISDRNRFFGAQGVLRSGHGVSIVSEITYPPFGYLMTHDSDPPTDEVAPISHFADAIFNERREVWIRLPVVNPYTAFPADYRPRAQVLKESQQNADDDDV